MAETYSTELTSVLDGTLPAVKSDGSVYGARLRRYRATITLASQGSTDTIVLAKPKDGETFAYGVMTSSATLGTSQPLIGTTDDPNGYKVAATFTGVLPVVFGATAGLTEGELDGDTEVKLTNSVAALPSSGTLVIDLFYSHS